MSALKIHYKTNLSRNMQVDWRSEKDQMIRAIKRKLNFGTKAVCMKRPSELIPHKAIFLLNIWKLMAAINHSWKNYDLEKNAEQQ